MGLPSHLHVCPGLGGRFPRQLTRMTLDWQLWFLTWGTAPAGCLSVPMTWQLALPRATEPRKSKMEA